MAARIKKGDEVIVISGRDKGKKGNVLKVLTEQNRVLVQGVHMVKRHQRQTQTEQGGIVEKEASIHVSNVALLDPEGGEASRIGFRTLEDGRKVRYARRSGEVID
ncbi:MAG: 50S ribosomal protein L24 [Alphaproteobacteria bacterium MarineAlpha11_Bin1]|nr:MAG: 50S ribosomal protein L24 [Alphaproteobacteria bacterium MarineAlpha11_Bin1]|tara:strand:- start:13663 stop:13977 length:315 start_codon:yes stop_codon:yes gene_type:complete